MSLEKLSQTEWLMRDDPHDAVDWCKRQQIKATAEGLSIDGDLITWEQLRVAMRIAQIPPPTSPSAPSEALTRRKAPSEASPTQAGSGEW